MKARKLILLGCCVFCCVLLGGGVWWWNSERPLTPDEKKHHAMDRDIRIGIWLAIASTKVPSALGATKMQEGWHYFLEQHGRKEQELVASGYFTNYFVSITNYPANISGNAKTDELQRRCTVAGLTNIFLSYGRFVESGNITITCRPSDLPQVIKAIETP